MPSLLSEPQRKDAISSAATTTGKMITSIMPSFFCGAPAASLVAVLPASGRICLHCQFIEDGKELRWLTDEQPVGRKGLDRGHRTPTARYLSRANDGDGR